MRRKEKLLLKAKAFADYVRDDYNKDRHISATLGSYGYTTRNEIDELVASLIEIKETEISEMILTR